MHRFNSGPRLQHFEHIHFKYRRLGEIDLPGGQLFRESTRRSFPQAAKFKPASSTDGLNLHRSPLREVHFA
jgi:hypothetical protein